MKSFASVSRELYEAKFKLPRRHKELKVDTIKAGGKAYTITYSQLGKDVYAFVNANETGPYNDLKDAGAKEVVETVLKELELENLKLGLT